MTIEEKLKKIKGLKRTAGESKECGYNNLAIITYDYNTNELSLDGYYTRNGRSMMPLPPTNMRRYWISGAITMAELREDIEEYLERVEERYGRLPEFIEEPEDKNCYFPHC